MQIVRVYHHTRGAVIECLNHLTFIQRQVHFIAFFPRISLDRIKSVSIKFLRSSKQVRVRSHVEHALLVPNRPCLALFPTRTIHQDWIALVDAAGDVSVAASAEDRRSASVGIDAGEVERGQGEAAICVVDGGGVVQEKGRIRSHRNGVPLRRK